MVTQSIWPKMLTPASSCSQPRRWARTASASGRRCSHLAERSRLISSGRLGLLLRADSIESPKRAKSMYGSLCLNCLPNYSYKSNSWYVLKHEFNVTRNWLLLLQLKDACMKTKNWFSRWTYFSCPVYLAYLQIVYAASCKFCVVN